MCTGRFHENGRPSPFSRCTQPCIHDGGRWGSTYCYIENGNWGAPCVPCKGIIQENGVKIVAFCHSKIPSILIKARDIYLLFVQNLTFVEILPLEAVHMDILSLLTALNAAKLVMIWGFLLQQYLVDTLVTKIPRIIAIKTVKMVKVQNLFVRNQVF